MDRISVVGMPFPGYLGHRYAKGQSPVNQLALISLCALIAAPAESAQTKATKESAVAALQKWETCANEQYALVTKIQEQRAVLPAGADTPEELKVQMRVALIKKDECDKLLAKANAESLRFAEQK